MWALTVSNSVVKVFRQPQAFERVIPNPNYPMEVPELAQDATPEQVAEHLMLEVQAEQVPQTLTVQEPKEAFTLWTEEQRRAIGLLPIVQDDRPDPWNLMVTGSTFEVLEDLVAEHWTTVAATADSRLELKRSAANALVNLIDGELEAHFQTGAQYGAQGKYVQLREKDQNRISAAGAQAKIMLLTGNGALWPADFAWIMADNTQTPLDAQGMSDLADAIIVVVTRWIFVAREHKDNIAMMVEDPNSTVYDINEYPYKEGWN